MKNLSFLIIVCAVLSASYSYDAQQTSKNNNEKTESEEECDYSGAEKSNESHRRELKIVFKSSTKIYALFNQTGKVGAVTDIKADLTLIFDENTHFAFIVDYKSNQSVAVSGKTTNIDWSHLEKLSSLKNIYDNAKKKGDNFGNTDVPKKDRKEVHDEIKGLNPKSSNLAELANCIRTSAKAIAKLSRGKEKKNVNTTYNGDLETLQQRLEALREVLSSVGRQNVPNLNQILSERSGVAILNIFVSSLSQSNARNVSFILTRFSSLVGQLEGNPRGFQRFQNVLDQLNNLQQNRGSISLLITILTQFFANLPPSDRSVFPRDLNNLNSFIRAVNRISSNRTQLSQLQNLTRIFQVNNGTRIVKALGNRGSGIRNIIHILTLLSRGYRPDYTFPNLLGQILAFYSSQNRSGFSNLFPNSNINEWSQSSSASVQKLINSYDQLGESFAQLFHDMSDFSEFIPIFGQMNKAAEIFTRGALSVYRLLSSYQAWERVREGFQNWMNSFGGGGSGNGFGNLLQNGISNFVGGSSGEKGGGVEQEIQNDAQNIAHEVKF